MERIVYYKKTPYTVIYDDVDEILFKDYTLGLTLDKKKRVRRVWMRKRNTCKGERYIALHRFILGLTDPNIIVDHRNRNPLDNRRCNLRTTDRYGNARNRTSIGGLSQYLGVSQNAFNKKYVASIHCEGITYSLGLFDNEIDAAKQYDSAAQYYFKEYANLNFPDEVKPFKPTEDIITESIQYFIDIGNPFKLKHVVDYTRDVYSKFWIVHYIRHHIESRLDELVDNKVINEDRHRTNPKKNRTWYYTTKTVDDMNQDIADMLVLYCVENHILSITGDVLLNIIKDKFPTSHINLNKLIPLLRKTKKFSFIKKGPVPSFKMIIKNHIHVGRPKKKTTTRNCTSQYIGVCWYKNLQKWVTKIGKNHLGYFINEEDAARAYDEAAKQYFGEFANLNFK